MWIFSFDHTKFFIASRSFLNSYTFSMNRNVVISAAFFSWCLLVVHLLFLGLPLIWWNLVEIILETARAGIGAKVLVIWI